MPEFGVLHAVAWSPDRSRIRSGDFTTHVWDSAGRAWRPLTMVPSRTEPSVPGTGTRLTRKEVDDHDD